MRRMLAGVLGTLLVCAAGWAWAAEPPMSPPKLSPEEAVAFDAGTFWWDVGEGDIVAGSEGTGGARGEAALPPPGERTMDHFYPFNPEEALGDGAGAWAEGWFEALYARDVTVYADECHVVDGRVASMLAQGVLAGEDERVFSITWDLRTGEQLRLSDLFYDGVDYIAYINAAAVRELMGTRDLDDYSFALTLEDLRRPFTGFPRNYPYFSITLGPHGGRMLVLGVAERNPLFSTENTSGRLAVPLPDDLSPYGLPWAEVTMKLAERPLPPDTGFFTRRFAESPTREAPSEEVYIARVRLGEGANAGVEDQVNAELAALAERAAAHPLRRLLGEYPPLEPLVRYDAAGKRLQAEYYAEIYDGEFLYDVGLLAAAEIDLDTGALLDGSGLAGTAPAYLMACGDWVQGYFHADLPEDFTLEPGSLYLGAWHSYDEEDASWRLCAAWLQPSGVEAYYETLVD